MSAAGLPAGGEVDGKPHPAWGHYPNLPPSPAPAPAATTQAQGLDERAVFEAWAKPRVFSLVVLDDDPEEYKELETASAWEAWQARAALSAQAQPPAPSTPEQAQQGAFVGASNWLWTHIKRGGEYRMLGAGKLQTDSPLYDMADVVVYTGEDGQLWAREVNEFAERFKRTKPLSSQPPAQSQAPAVLSDAEIDALMPEPDGYAAIAPEGTHSIVVPPQDFAKVNGYSIFTREQVHATVRAAMQKGGAV